MAGKHDGILSHEEKRVVIFRCLNDIYPALKLDAFLCGVVEPETAKQVTATVSRKTSSAAIMLWAPMFRMTSRILKPPAALMFPVSALSKCRTRFVLGSRHLAAKRSVICKRIIFYGSSAKISTCLGGLVQRGVLDVRCVMRDA